MNFWSSARIAHSEAALPSSQRQAAPRLDLQQTGGAADHTQRMPEAHSMRYHQQHSLPRTADVNVYQTSSYPITTSPLLSQLPAGIGTELLGTTISPAATDDDDAHHHQQQPHQRPTVLSSSCFLWHELPTAGIEVNALLKAVFLDTQQQSVAGQRSTDDNAAVIAPPTTTAVHLPTDTVVMTAARLISGCPSAQYVDSKVDAMECNTVVGCIEDCAVQSKPREESACLNSFISDSTIESASVIDMAVDKNLTTSSPTPMHPNVYSTTDTTSLHSTATQPDTGITDNVVVGHSRDRLAVEATPADSARDFYDVTSGSTPAAISGLDTTFYTKKLLCPRLVDLSKSRPSYKLLILSRQRPLYLAEIEFLEARATRVGTDNQDSDEDNPQTDSPRIDARQDILHQYILGQPKAIFELLLVNPRVLLLIFSSSQELVRICATGMLAVVSNPLEVVSLISSTPNEHVQGGMTTLLSRLLTKSLEIVVRLVDHPLIR
eukprot:Lankesteria_metandrocarpae@DN2836_c0_g1_i2.p1